jgi:hypothetical protein
MNWICQSCGEDIDETEVRWVHPNGLVFCDLCQHNGSAARAEKNIMEMRNNRLEQMEAFMGFDMYRVVNKKGETVKYTAVDDETGEVWDDKDLDKLKELLKHDFGEP